MLPRFRLPLFLALHLLASAAVAGVFASQFSHNPHAILSHLIVLAVWDAMLVALLSMFVSVSAAGARWPFLTYRIAMALTCTLQIYLYALDGVSNASWGRNITGHLVLAFAPTVWSGREPFPVGALGISAFACGTLVAMLAMIAWPRILDEDSRSWRFSRLRAAATALIIATVFGL